MPRQVGVRREQHNDSSVDGGIETRHVNFSRLMKRLTFWLTAKKFASRNLLPHLCKSALMISDNLIDLGGHHVGHQSKAPSLETEKSDEV